MQRYTKSFYKKHQDQSRRSAKEVVPLVVDLIQPKHVIDVGCGIGTWLSVFRECGIEEVFGVDGDWVNNEEMLEIPKARFRSFDLKEPLYLDRQFDLVVSLEVAEHLPPECAETFIDSLSRLGPVVLFSAAIPYQGGTHHVNEQWPEYWAQYFRDRAYEVIDCIRRKIWHNDDVEWFYAQNMLLFVRMDYLESHPSLKRKFENTTPSALSIVHPQKYLQAVELMRSLHLMAQDIAALIPPRDAFILVDDAYLQQQIGVELTTGHRAIPFLERDVQYWAAPQDDTAAIQEFERLRRCGARFIVFGWPAFWWLDYYARLNEHLRSNYHCILENDRLVAFALQP
jgi:cyclopropane fatty-acyl-phospholipid synthase-like methyltransferase